MMLVSVFAAAITLGAVSQALDKTWTVSGVATSVFGVGVMSLLLPTGLAHGLAAAFPLIFDRWKHKRNLQLGDYVMLQLDGLKFFYSLLGWTSSIGLVVLFAYQLMSWVA